MFCGGIKKFSHLKGYGFWVNTIWGLRRRQAFVCDEPRTYDRVGIDVPTIGDLSLTFVSTNICWRLIPRGGWCEPLGHRNQPLYEKAMDFPVSFGSSEQGSQMLPRTSTIIMDRRLSTGGVNVPTSFLVGGLEHFLFSHILGIIILMTNIFQRGSNHQPDFIVGSPIKNGWVSMVMLFYPRVGSIDQNWVFPRC